MATDRQIAANRRNAQRSSGPSPEGRLRSRLNATKHGMAAALPEVEAGLSPEFAERRAKWAAEQGPTGEAANWAFDKAVAASLQIDRCERALEEAVALHRQRAKLAWDEDRAVEAEEIAARLAREPALASRRLRTTRAGVEWLIDAWLGLLGPLDAGHDWSEAESSKALDLLGISPDRREGSDPLGDAGIPADVEARRGLALEELDRLEALLDEAMVPLDEAERKLAMTGDIALLSGPAKLILRYERDAWKRYRESTRRVQQAPTLSDPPPAVAPPTRAVEPAPTPPARPGREHRPAPLGAIARRGPEVPGWPGPMPTVDDEASAWLVEIERRFAASGSPAPRRDGTNPILANRSTPPLAAGLPPMEACPS